MEIVHFDYHNSQNFITLKNYLLIPTTFYLFGTIRNAKCIPIKDGIICGFISPNTENKTDSLYLFSIDPNSDYNKTKTIKIYEYEASLLYTQYEKRWIELMPISRERFMYCVQNEKNQIYCGIAQIQEGLNIEKLYEPIMIIQLSSNQYNFYPYCSKLIINDNELAMGCKVPYKGLITIKKIIIDNGIIIQKQMNVSFSENYFEMLKDNNDNLILLVDHNNSLYITDKNIKYYGYSTCKDINRDIYNGEVTKIDFNDMVPIINFKQDEEDIIFIFNDTELLSLITKNNEIVKSNKTYNKNDIYFKLNTTNFDYIKNKGQYSVIYSNTLNEKTSRRCLLNLTFNKCPKKCELCTGSGGCYDRYWNITENNEKPSNSKTLIIVIIIVILLIIILIIVFLVYRYLKKNKKNSNDTMHSNDDYLQGSDFTQIMNDKNNSKYNNNQSDYTTQPLMPVNEETKGNPNTYESNSKNSNQVTVTPGFY